mmetsp:Transcript_116258/g.335830  ORF Transcript_116258/g.335830 Transcript_116258/m.335830 type:complete len:372 (-) Transcript_116258:357-1472(-)
MHLRLLTPRLRGLLPSLLRGVVHDLRRRLDLILGEAEGLGPATELCGSLQGGEFGMPRLHEEHRRRRRGLEGHLAAEVDDQRLAGGEADRSRDASNARGDPILSGDQNANVRVAGACVELLLLARFNNRDPGLSEAVRRDVANRHQRLASLLHALAILAPRAFFRALDEGGALLHRGGLVHEGLDGPGGLELLGHGGPTGGNSRLHGQCADVHEGAGLALAFARVQTQLLILQRRVDGRDALVEPVEGIVDDLCEGELTPEARNLGEQHGQVLARLAVAGDLLQEQLHRRRLSLSACAHLLVNHLDDLLNVPVQDLAASAESRRGLRDFVFRQQSCGLLDEPDVGDLRGLQHVVVAGHIHLGDGAVQALLG